MKEELGRSEGGELERVFQGESEIVSERIWDNVEAELFPKKNRKGFIFWLSCFVGTAAVGTALWFAFGQYNDTSSLQADLSVVEDDESNGVCGVVQESHSGGYMNSFTLSAATTKKSNSQDVKEEDNVQGTNTDKYELHRDTGDIPLHQDLAQRNSDGRVGRFMVEELPKIVVSEIDNSLKDNSILPSYLIPPKNKYYSRFDLSYNASVGKNVRMISGELDLDHSLSKNNKDRRVVLNLVQHNFGVHYALSDKYELRTGFGYGTAVSRSKWFNRPTHLNMGENNLRFQTSEGYFAIQDTTLVNSLNSGDTTNLRIKTHQSVQFISVPFMVSRLWQKKRWGVSLNVGASADFHFNSALSFEIEEDNEVRELQTESEQKQTGVSLQALLGVGVQYRCTPSISVFAEQKLSIPVTSYLNSTSYSARSVYSNIGLGIRINLPCRERIN